jgi:hypothetical protein
MLVIGLVMLGLGLGGGYFLFANKSQTEPTQKMQSSNVIQPTLTSKPTNNVNLCSNVIYTAPKNWKDMSDSFSNCPKITSPDYVAGQSDMFFTAGTLIQISAGINDYIPDLAALKKSLKEDTAGVSNVQDTTLASFPAVKYQVNYEGFRDNYSLIHNGVEYTVSIQYAGKTAQEAQKNKLKYSEDISNFLQTITIK